ncbi:MAG: site-2 protease family protein [Verrucomicrobiia bacterium]
MNSEPDQRPPVVPPWQTSAAPAENASQPPSAFIKPRQPSLWERLKKVVLPLAGAVLVLAKYVGKLKFVVVPLLKFIPAIIKTGGSMLVTIWFYAMNMGWWFGVGFVLLIFIHECGHLLAAKRIGLKVGAPVFIPFMGAFIALKEAPRNAWIEAQVGIGGPLLGSLAALACYGVYAISGMPLFRLLAYTGFFLNLFNLTPVGFLDGGRVVTALSPWLWLVGLPVMVWLAINHFNPILFLVIVASFPRLFFLFREKSAEERRYFEVTPQQRAIMALLYFGLLGLLVTGMGITQLHPVR